MSSSLWAMTVIMALGGGPYGCPTCYSGGTYAGGYGMPAYGGGYYGGAGGGGLYATSLGLNGYSGSNGDTLLPFDSQEAWMHGYFQEISPYPGYHYFAPYNYKHVLSQADLAYRWGQPQGLPYSQQWWHRYHARAALNPGQQAQLTQARAAYEAEMAHLQAWRDFQAQQLRLSSMLTSPAASAPTSVVMPVDPTTQAVHVQQSGARAYVAPAAPLFNDSTRVSETPMIPEFAPQQFNPRFEGSGPNLR